MLRSRSSARVCLGAKAGIARDLDWLAPGIGPSSIDQRNESGVVVGIVAEAMGEDDLPLSIDCRLCVVSLDEPVAADHDAAVGVGEIALRLGSGCSRRMFRLTAA